jgi:hypothetical protein
VVLRKSDSNEFASEINLLWLEIYRLWEEAQTLEGISETNCNETIAIFSKLLKLIDKESDPHSYSVALRMRAQNYCLINKYDDALEDLKIERELNERNNDQIRVEKCDELISQITNRRIDEMNG